MLAVYSSRSLKNGLQKNMDFRARRLVLPLSGGGCADVVCLFDQDKMLRIFQYI